MSDKVAARSRGERLVLGWRGSPKSSILTALAMVAFAANSVLCRLALAQTGIDPPSFTLTRIVSGALMLAALSVASGQGLPKGGSGRAALALFSYAAAFSFAYVSLPAGSGALLLFGAVQATMVVTGLVRGERLTPRQWAGLSVAFVGLIALVAPGVSAPPLVGSALMLGAGVAWGAYSLMGRRSTNPLGATGGNFAYAVPMAALAAAPFVHGARPLSGLVYAALSGALASGVGYAIWYAALPRLSAAQGASVQLSVPVITALGGAAVLGEFVTLRLILASTAILGGISLVMLSRPRRN